MATTTEGRLSVLNWETTGEVEPSALAGCARRASALALLLLEGIRGQSERLGIASDEIDEELLADAVALTGLLCANLDRRLEENQPRTASPAASAGQRLRAVERAPAGEEGGA